MTPIEKQSLVNYLEFRLSDFCEQLDKDLDPDASGRMYNIAYDILNDMDQNMQDIIDFDVLSTQTN